MLDKLRDALYILFCLQNQPMSILKIPAEAVGNFQGDYEPTDFSKLTNSYSNGGASYGGGGRDDEFDQSDDDQQAQAAGTLDFDEGYDCKCVCVCVLSGLS